MYRYLDICWWHQYCIVCGQTQGEAWGMFNLDPTFHISKCFEESLSLSSKALEIISRAEHLMPSKRKTSSALLDFTNKSQQEPHRERQSKLSHKKLKLRNGFEIRKLSNMSSVKYFCTGWKSVLKNKKAESSCEILWNPEDSEEEDYTEEVQ